MVFVASVVSIQHMLAPFLTWDGPGPLSKVKRMIPSGILLKQLLHFDNSLLKWRLNYLDFVLSSFCLSEQLSIAHYPGGGPVNQRTIG